MHRVTISSAILHGTYSSFDYTFFPLSNLCMYNKQVKIKMENRVHQLTPFKCYANSYLSTDTTEQDNEDGVRNNYKKLLPTNSVHTYSST